MSAAAAPHSLRKVFGTPLLLAALSVVGLVSALVGDGVFDALSWLGLGIPVLVIVRHAWSREPPRPKP